jgi:hypothetical protein
MKLMELRSIGMRVSRCRTEFRSHEKPERIPHKDPQQQQQQQQQQQHGMNCRSSAVMLVFVASHAAGTESFRRPEDPHARRNKIAQAAPKS